MKKVGWRGSFGWRGRAEQKDLEAPGQRAAVGGLQPLVLSVLLVMGREGSFGPEGKRW